MHVPDGFLDLKTIAATSALALAGLGVALRQARRRLPRRRVPLLGLAAAFVFAAQMLNFPVGVTSGHLIGGVLVASLLGPSAAVIVISAVLIVQALLFQDGGITALGANIFNMALVGGVGGWAIYFAVSRVVSGLFGRVFAATFAAWCATVLAAIACAGELAASHTLSWSIAFSAMAGVHMLIGLVEALITALVLVAVSTSRPELLVEPPHAASARPYGAVVAYGALIAIGLVLFVSPLASALPDGLHKMAADYGFARKAGTVIPAPMPEYKVEWLSAARLSTSIAGAVGTVVVFGLAWVLARTLVPKAKVQVVTDGGAPARPDDAR